MNEFKSLKEKEPDSARLVELLYNRTKINDMLPSDALAEAFNLGATYSQVKHDKIYTEQAELDRQRAIEYQTEQQLLQIMCAIVPMKINDTMDSDLSAANLMLVMIRKKAKEFLKNNPNRNA